MKNKIYILNINNYSPKLMSITVPTIENYAKKINADLEIISKRKFKNYHPVVEKLQLSELTQNNEWSMIIDGDCLINPKLNNLFLNDKNFIYGLTEYKLDLCFNEVPLNKIGLSSTLIIWNKKFKNLWDYSDLDLNMIKNYKLDELVINYNIKKFCFNYNSPFYKDLKQSNYLIHLDAFDDGRQKMSDSNLYELSKTIVKSWF